MRAAVEDASLLVLELVVVEQGEIPTSALNAMRTAIVIAFVVGH